MITAPIPVDEEHRLAALDHYAILDTEAEERFDRITRLAAKLSDAPIALISLVDRDRQWFKSKIGLDVTETSRDISFCSHVVHSGEPLLVDDARSDVRFHDNPLVTGDPAFGSYIGAPLKTRNGHAVGTLCVVYPQERKLAEETAERLMALAELVVDQLELRLAQMTAEEATRRADDANHAYQESESRFRDFARIAADWLWETDESHRYVFASSGRSDRTVLQKENIIGHTRWEAYGIDPEAPENWAYNEALKARRRIRDFRFGFVDGTGQQQYRAVNARPIWDDDGKFKGYRGVTTDETARVEMLHALEKAKEQAEQANMVKDEFFANMSHELRTPLNAVIGFSELINQVTADGPDQEVIREYADYINASGQQLLGIIGGILELTQVESENFSLNPKPVDIRSMVDEAMQSIAQPAAEKGLALELSVGPEMDGEFDLDRGRVGEVLRHILDNAVKFTDDGSIGLAVSLRAENKNARELLFEISDTGRGFPGKDAERLFERFYQRDASYTRQNSGCGLGLSIVARLVKRMNGQYGATSHLGEGSVFWVSIPVPEDTDEGMSPPTLVS